MKRAGRWIASGLGAFGRLMAVLGVLYLVYGLWLLGDAGNFAPLPTPTTHNCTPIEAGPLQDAIRDPVSGKLYLALAAGAAKAGIYRFDPAQPLLESLTADAAPDFAPIALSLYQGTDGITRLFVLDHREGGTRVEIFELAERGATLRETIGDPALFDLHGIVAVGPRQFYVTRGVDHDGLVPRIGEALLGLPTGAVLYFDGTLADPAATGLVTPRGMAMAGGRLYVAEQLRHRLRVLRPEPRTGALAFDHFIDLPAMPEGLSLGDGGALYAALQPRPFRAFLHGRYAALKAPAALARVEGVAAGIVFADDGTALSAPKAGLQSNGMLVTGGDRQNSLLVCHP